MPYAHETNKNCSHTRTICSKTVNKRMKKCNDATTTKKKPYCSIVLRLIITLTQFYGLHLVESYSKTEHFNNLFKIERFSRRKIKKNSLK